MNKQKKKVNKLAIVNKNVCGIDVGSTFHQTAIGMETKHSIAQSPILRTTITIKRLRKRRYVTMLNYYHKVKHH